MGSTGASPLPGAWRQAGWLLIGRALLERGEPMTAGEIAAAIGKDQSNTRRAAQAMAKAGLLEEQPSTREHARPGRKARIEFALPSSSVATLEHALAEAVVPGMLRRAQQLVFVQADGPALRRMTDALAEAGFGARGSWSAICDGAPQEYVLAFDGAEAVRAAVDLMSMLSAAEVACRRVGVVELMSARELASWSRETAGRARRLQVRRDTRHAAGG